MKFVHYDAKNPKKGVNRNSHGDLKKECEIKICAVGREMVFYTHDSTVITSEVISIDESFSHILVQTQDSFYTFEK